MNKDDELSKIMREILDIKRDQELAKMSERDRRIVCIAQGVSSEEVRRQIGAQRTKALVWPFVQAMAACVVLFGIFAFGFVQTVSGSSIGQLPSLAALVCASFVFASLAQLVLQGRRP